MGIDVHLKATKEFKKAINYLNHRKLSISYKKTNFINFLINKNDNNHIDELKLCFVKVKIIVMTVYVTKYTWFLI